MSRRANRSALVLERECAPGRNALFSGTFRLADHHRL